MRKGILLLMALMLLGFVHTELRAESIKIEAESGKTANCTIVSGSQYSGQKAVQMTDEKASLTLTVEIEQKQKYTIRVAAEGIGGQKDIRCSVNGAATIFKANSYTEVEIGSFFLNAGKNEIKITPSWTWFNIDYVRLEESQDHIAWNIDDSPVTKDATPAAQALYGFLKENFGKRTIAGMMTGSMDGTSGSNIKTHEDVVAVYKASGRYPALVGFDFMNSTGSAIDRNDSWTKTYANKVISLAKDTWRKGGIPDFTWHWRDPSRKTSDFYTDKSGFDITTAMNADGTWNTASTVYKNLIKDIDIVADYFLQMQNEGMACIFRPLHEASGGWFWWGAKGAEPCKKLYRLIYHEMVEVKGVRNVIWDWNADFTLGNAWCPGEEYYDVISTDIYNNAYDYSSNYPAFDKLKATSGGKKIIALAENGPIPDIEKQADEDAWWSWWMPWYQSWNGGFVNKTSNAEWTKCMQDSRVITLDDMPGWDNYANINNAPGIENLPEATYSLSGVKLPFANKEIMIVKGRKVMVAPDHCHR